MDNYLYVSNSNLQVLQYMLYKCLNEASELPKLLQQGDVVAMAQMANTQQGLTPKGVRMTVTVITIIPVLWFILLCKNILQKVL